MIDYLTFIEELETINKILTDKEHPHGENSHEFSSIVARGKSRELKRKYEKRVSNFESDMAPKEEVDILKMSPNRGSSFMSNYQEGGAGYDDSKEYEENSEGDIVPVEQKKELDEFGELMDNEQVPASQGYKI